MKKIPSFGFVYLVFIVLITFQLFGWVVAEGWYDRIHTLSQTNKDFKKWANYLANVAEDFEGKSVRGEILQKAGSLYMRIGDKKNATGVYRRLTRLFPDNITYLSQLNCLLYTSAKDRAEVVTSARKLYKSGHINENILKVLLEQSLKGDDEIKKDELAEQIFSGKYTQFCTFIENGDIALCNLTIDRWSTNMKPFFIAIKNPQDEEVRVKLELGCWPSSKFVPIIVEIKGVDFEKRVVFNKKTKFHTIILTVPPNEVGLFKGNTNKTWRAAKDPRKLGVNVRSVKVIGSTATQTADDKQEAGVSTQ